MRQVTSFLFCAALLFLESVASAVPTSVPYVGRLTYDSGAPYAPPGGTVNITAALYFQSSSGTPVWGPVTIENVPVHGGVLSFVLDGAQAVGNLGAGPVVLADVLAAESAGLWLDIAVGNTPMSPRQRIHCVPFAALAQDAAAVGGIPAAELATLDDLEAVQPAPSQGPVRRSYTEVAGRQMLSGPNFSLSSAPPTVTQGAQAMTLTHTPLAAGNALLVRVLAYVGEQSNHSDIMVATLFSGNTLLASGLSHDHYYTFPGNLNFSPIAITRQITAASTAPVTFSVRVGSFGSGPVALNGTDTNLFGGSFVSSIEVLEYAP